MHNQFLKNGFTKCALRCLALAQMAHGADITRGIGARLTRREDPALITGGGAYTDDVPFDDPLYVSFLRSPIAAGQITGIDLEEAQTMPGVCAAHSAPDLGPLGTLSINPVLPIETATPYPVLAQDQVLSLGQPIAAILADHPARAQDACEVIALDLDETAMPEPVRIAGKSWTAGDTAAAFAKAALIVEAEIRHPRLAPSPMEPRAIAVRYDAEADRATIYHATQTPHRTRSELARILGIAPERLRVIAPEVGGAFGMKASLYPEEVFTVWAAIHHKRDVKWTATRSEEFLSATHGRALTTRGRLALDAKGRFLALEARVAAPLGGWLPNSALIPAWNAARVLPSAYRVPNLDLATEASVYALPPTGIYRGAGRPEANMLMERLIDKAAAAIGCDPLPLRRANMVPPDAMPHQTATGNTLDSGDYPALLDRLAADAGYDALKARRDTLRASGRLAGLGLAFYLEPSGSGWETARVTLLPNGEAHVESGSSSQGHGRLTAYAQIASDMLDLPPDRITVCAGDTGRCPEGIGALASRSTAIGGSAVREACRAVMAKLASGAPLPITRTIRYVNNGQAWGYGAYLIVVEIDRDTGALSVLSAHAMDDAGVVVNPTLVEGQILGGFAQGFGEAMMEELTFDAEGQLLTGSFMDYAMPRATDVPPLTLTKSETPSPTNSLGAKGVGEAGTIGAPPALLNAAIDALRPLGVTDLTMPLTPARVWAAMQAADKG